MSDKTMKNIPKLRFHQFTNTGEWATKALSEIAKKVNSKNKDLEHDFVLTNSATDGIVSQRDYFDKDIANKNNLGGYYIVDINDFVYNPRISSAAPVGSLKRNKLSQGIMSPLYMIFRFKKGNLSFFEHYFESSHWHSYMRSIANMGAKFDRLNLNNQQFFSLLLPYPDLKEQEKIADCFSSIDSLISLESQKLELLKEHKKGLMQKFFPQNGETVPKLRFPKFEHDGKWQKYSLNKLGKTYNGLSGKTAQDFGNGNSSYITYKNIFDNFKIKTSIFGIVNVDNEEKQNLVQFGDIFFTISSETMQEIGMSSVLLDDIEDTYLNSFCFGYRLNDFNTLCPYFARFYFRSALVRDQISKLAQGSTRFNLSKEKVMKITILLPSIEEQQKIADFLSSVDEEINLQSQKVESLKEHKKALLQQLFPSNEVNK